MPYYVVHPNGSKYGPAELPTLQKWVQEGRITEQTNLEDAETGRTIPASLLSGLVFQPATPPVSSAPPTYSQPTAPGNPYSQPKPPENPYAYSAQQSPMGGYQRTEKVDNHLIKAIFATVCCCLPLGVVAIVYAAQVDGAAARGDTTTAYENAEKADSWANWSIGLGLVGGVISFIVNLAAFSH